MARPLKFPSVQDLQAKIDAYFKEREAIEQYPNGDIIQKPITITGLALALGTSRETLVEYQERDEFVDAISEAKLRCENYAEEKLYTGPATGPIFALKNYGWRDKSESETYGKDGGAIEQNITVKYVDSLPKND